MKSFIIRMAVWLSIVLLCARVPAGAQESPKPVYLGFDGEYGMLHSTSAQAIERGIRIALTEINANGGVLGRPMALLTKDNRSVPARGVANLRAFAENPDVVAVMGGRFSPVLLEQVPVAHELGMILLDAWASADGVTQHNFQPSYTFRLSLRDQIAAPVMLRHAASLGAHKIGVLVPNTGWGRSNHNAITAQMAHMPELTLAEAIWYNWGEKDMLQFYLQLRQAGAQAIVLVANDIEGALLVRQLGELAPPGELNAALPIISHWGVTGGEFVKNAGPALFELNFTVVQTFSFFTAQNPVRDRVLHIAQQQFGIEHIEDIASPVGLAHAYDLTHLLARAIIQAGTTERAKVRDELENIKEYQGLTGVYAQPFTAKNHDALQPEQVFMARYQQDGGANPRSSLRRVTLEIPAPQ